MDSNEAFGWGIFWSVVIVVLIVGVLYRHLSRTRRGKRLYHLLNDMGWIPPGGGFDNETPATVAFILERELDRRGKYRGVGPKGYRRSDDRIREDINDRLTYSGDLDPTEVMVEVNDGVVVLKGFVENRVAARRTEEIAESVPGVNEVRNELQVSRPSERAA